jgi:hypothetical protein
VHHLFGDWLHGFNNVLKTVFILGATMMCWVLWIHRNDLVFEKKNLLRLCKLSIWRLKGFQIGLSFSERRCSRWLRRDCNSWCRSSLRIDCRYLGRVLHFFLFFVLFFSLAMCVRQRPGACTKTLYPLDVTFLVNFSIELPLSKKLIVFIVMLTAN